MTAQEGPSPGRPRSAEADRAILRATFAALLDMASRAFRWKAWRERRAWPRPRSIAATTPAKI